MLEFRILGSVEVVRDGRPLPLGGAKQRAMIADLVLHANEVVSADRLIDDLWGEEPPGTAPHMLHVYVSRLRKTLEDHGRDVLVTRSPGYVLTLEPPDELDAARFEQQVQRGVERLGSRPVEALELLDQALARWRGRALEEFADETFAQPSAARLEGLRQATQERRVEALLALGRHEEALVELEALIARFPLRERLRELQMIALYRAGRQADALDAFQTARRTLGDELGVDPGPALVSLEQAILRQDPELDAPAIPPHTAEAGDAPAPRRAHRAGRIAALAAGVAIVVVVALMTLTPGPEGPPGTPTSAPGPTGTLQWTEVPDPGGQVFGGAGDQVILGGVETSHGLLAVGSTAARRSTATSTRDYDAAVWIASDPTDWLPVTDAAFVAPGNQEATDAVVIPDRTVVVGSDASHGDHDAAVWTLEDGLTSWHRVDPEARGMRETGEQGVRGATWTGSHVIAVGFSRLEDDDAAIWTSEDGLDWTLLTPTTLDVPGDQQMITVTTFGGLIVAAGYSESPEGRDAAVWVSADDGLSWESVPDGALGGEGDQQINSVLAAGPGLVAVGSGTVEGDVNAVVWVSVDGHRWTRVEDPAGVLGGPGLQEMSAIASSGSLIVAAGREVGDLGTDAAVWTSPDGTVWLRQSPTSSGMATLADFGKQGVRELLVGAGEFIALGREGRGGDDDADVWIGRPG